MRVGTRRPFALALVLLSVLGAIFAWVLWPDGSAETQEVFDPESVQPVLRQLAPSTTFHTVDVIYRRHGPTAEQIPESEGPETQRTDAWMRYDEQGVLVEYRTETRSMDGILLATQMREGDDLVSYDADGLERHRITVGSRGSVSGLKTRVGEVTANAYSAVQDRLSTSTIDMAGRSVVLLEDRKPFRSGVPVRPDSSAAQGFELPYVDDLNPVEEIRRDYILADEYRSIRSEVVIVGDDGTETVVESRHHDVFEVIQAAAP